MPMHTPAFLELREILDDLLERTLAGDIQPGVAARRPGRAVHLAGSCMPPSARREASLHDAAERILAAVESPDRPAEPDHDVVLERISALLNLTAPASATGRSPERESAV